MVLKINFSGIVLIVFMLLSINCFSQQPDYSKKIETYQKRLDSIEQISGTENLEYGKNLFRLSKELRKEGNLYEAKENNIKANSIFSNLQYFNWLAVGQINLSQIYRALGKFDRAISIQSEALLYFGDEDKKTANYLGGLNNLAILYGEIGDYKTAIPIFKEILSILPETHKGFLSVNISLAETYQRLGDYENALKIYLELLDSGDKGHKDYWQLLQNLAFVYVKLGEFDKAMQMYDEALVSCETQLGEGHFLYGKLQNNVGKLYFQMGNIEKAQELFKDAIDNLLIKYDTSKKEYGYYLNDYAATFLYQGDYDKAISLLEDNVDIGKENLNKEGLDYWNRNYHLANAYNMAGRYEEAKPILEKATTEIRNILGENHTTYAKMLNSLCETYIALDLVDKAIPLLEESNSIFVSELNNIFQFRSEQEKKAYLQLVLKHFDFLQSIPIVKNEDYPKLNNINLNNQLMLKGLLLNNSKNILEKLSKSNDTLIQNKVIAYRSEKSKISSLLSQPFDDRDMDVDSLKEIVNRKEVDLVKYYSDNFGSDYSLNKDWKKLQDHLKKKELAIEYSRFQLTKGNKVLDTVFYAAYLYQKNWENPIMVPLFEDSQLKEALSKKTINQLYASRGSKAVSKADIKEVYELLWAPIETYVKDVETIYFSPSGLLNQVPFAAINLEGEPSLNEQFDLIQLSSTEQLNKVTVNPNLTGSMFIGGVNYDYSKESLNTSDTLKYANLNTDNIGNSGASNNRGDNWAYLPGTLKEIEDIQATLKSKNIKYSSLIGDQATESNFKKISGNSPSVLHIATHGFFFEDSKDLEKSDSDVGLENEFKFAENPLLRSGLLLAGANHVWKNGVNLFENEDGILTALEISNLDLSNTDIVVLSACETGLGDIEGSEGVYGLQRAFKMAGVDIIVMSLWQVPDTETAEFMNLFYLNWIQGLQVRQAFIQAQKTMQKKYENDPLKWAAFVLLE